MSGDWRLDGGHDGAGFAVEAVLAAVVADIVDYAARDRVVVEDAAEFPLDRDFTGDDDEAGGDQGFAADASHGVVLEHGVENRIGNRVRNLIGVALGYRLRGEQELIIGMCQNSVLRRNKREFTCLSCASQATQTSDASIGI